MSALEQEQMHLDTLDCEDALTGLPKRRSFEEHVREATASASSSEIQLGSSWSRQEPVAP